MSNRDPDARLERPEQGIPWAIRECIKQMVHTAMPGLIERYDPATRRARVVPALRTRYRPSRDMPSKTEDKAVILDVPVLHPSAGGFVVHLPIAKGDPVMLLFSERGIETFKTRYAMSDPPRGVFFQPRDAVAIPGFGALEFTPLATDALTMQTEDGSTGVIVRPGNIELRSDTLTHNGVNIGETHTHGGVRPGSANTSTPE